MDSLQKERIYKSIPLSTAEINALKKWIKENNNGVQEYAAEDLKISRTTLRNVLKLKTCAHKTYQKIKQVLPAATAA